ncbi:MAG: U32 family peptidase C-terminal domain-containing protein, partial [Pseudomonadota bacterium]|nr:U32 family peptidase C-terminal domain-containing protein [Pseudomonadota bacterium]MDP1906627.1 U32 family peptidase C-terminal domain-containing protein [Pseudomonadota bacterium]MDP2354046.1 U32 family peptidase C-terminal domain-containing protein [Pseudomonadota bacterium]
ADGLAEIEVKNKFSVGDRIEVIHPGGNSEIVIGHMTNPAGKDMPVAPGNGHKVKLALPPGREGAFLARFV